MLISIAENIYSINGFVKKDLLLLGIFILLFTKPMMVKAEIVNNPVEKGINSAEIQVNKAVQKEASKNNWRVINDASFQISPAPPPLRAKGETLKQLGFDDIDTLLASIEKKQSITVLPSVLMDASSPLDLMTTPSNSGIFKPKN